MHGTTEERARLTLGVPEMKDEIAHCTPSTSNSEEALVVRCAPLHAIVIVALPWVQMPNVVTGFAAIEEAVPLPT